VMVELALYGVARVYWTAFDGALSPYAVGLSKVLVGFGALTALVGAVMCFAQQHLKRLLAFSTVSHIGLFLVGMGVLNHVGLAGVAVFRAAGRVFLGLGPREAARFASERLGEVTQRETQQAEGRTPIVMLAPAAVLLAGALVVGVLPGVSGRVERAAAEFEDRT